MPDTSSKPPLTIAEAIDILGGEGGKNQAAAKLGTSRQTIYNWLNGTKPLSIYHRKMEKLLEREVIVE